MKKTKQSKKKAEEIIHKIQYNVTNLWISLVNDKDQADTPSLAELHSIIKFNLLLIESLTGFEMDQVLNQIVKDMKDNKKALHNVVIDEMPNKAIKDFYKHTQETFKRYK